MYPLLDPACAPAVSALERDPFYGSITAEFAGDDVRRRAALAGYFDYSIRQGTRIGRVVHLEAADIGIAVWVLAAVALAIAFFVLEPFFVAPTTHAGGPEALAGESAPVLTLRDDRGDPVSLDRYRGRFVLMNLWASWCPPCRSTNPVVAALARDFKVCKVNVDKNQALAARYEVSSIPTFLVFRGGRSRNNGDGENGDCQPGERRPGIDEHEHPCTSNGR